MKRLLGAAMAAAMLAGTPVRAAEPAPEPPPPMLMTARDSLVAEFASVMFPLLQLDERMRPQLARVMIEAARANPQEVSPAYLPFAEEAAAEVVDEMWGELLDYIAHAITKDMTEAELSAGIALLRSDVGRIVMTAAVEDREPVVTDAQREAARQWMADPAMQGFLAKLRRIRENMAGIGERFGPPMTKRFIARLKQKAGRSAA